MGVVQQLDLDGFTFPIQPTSSRTTNISLPSLTFDSNYSKLHNQSDLSESSREPSHLLLENFSSLNGTTIIRGGFDVKKEACEYTAVGMRCYPPPPNAAYSLTSQAHASKDTVNTGATIATPPSKGAGSKKQLDDALVKNICGLELGLIVDDLKHHPMYLDGAVGGGETGIAPRKFDIQNTFTKTPGFGRNPPTKGELLADTIDFERKSWVMTTPGVSGELYPGKEQRASTVGEDFIRFIDSYNPESEYCKKCKTSHIPPGPPITLEDRDTCGSQLPEWFPAEDYEKPWKDFNKMINDWVYLTELAQGYNHKPNPDVPVWDFYFHDYSKKWKVIHRRGGWWKCRDGKDASELERACELCHAEKVKEKAEEEKDVSSVAKRLKVINDFIEFHTKRACEKDKAMVIAHARLEGIPEYIGPRTIEDVQFNNPVLSRNASASTIHTPHRTFSMDTTWSYLAYDKPVKQHSPVPERSVAKDCFHIPQSSPARDRSPGGERSPVKGRSPPRNISPLRHVRE